MDDFFADSIDFLDSSQEHELTELKRRLYCLGALSKDDPNNFHPNGLLKTSDLECTPKTWCTFFQQSLNFPHEFETYLTELFLLCRKYLLLVTYSSETIEKNALPLTSGTCELFRDNLCLFLNYLHYFIKKNPTNINVGTLNTIVKNTRSMLNLLNRHLTDDQLTYVFQSHQKSNKLRYQRIHCHLECRWLILEIINSLESFSFMSESIKLLKLEQEIQLTVKTLEFFCKKKFSAVSKSELNEQSPFDCICFKEVWLLLLKSQYTKKYFWMIMSEILKDSVQKTEEAEYCIWLLAHLSNMPVLNDDNSLKFELIDNAIKSFFSRAIVSEQQLRTLIELIDTILTNWGYHRSESIISLWEYFYDKLNSTFYANGMSLTNFSLISKNGESLLEQVKLRFNKDSKSKEESSYSLFLRLIANHLVNCRENKLPPARLCGRIFLKFPVSRVDKLQILLDIGFYHLTSLYLTLVIGTENPSTVLKLIELLVNVPRHDTSSKQLEAIWKSLAACLLLISELKWSIFNECIQVILPFAGWCIDTDNVTPLGNLVDVLIAILSKDLSLILNASDIVNSWIEKYLKVCSSSEISRVFSAFGPFMEKCSANSTPEVIKLRDKVIAMLMPILALHPSLTAAELAGHFALACPRDRATIFNFWSEHLNSLISAKFLSILLQSKDGFVLMQYPQLPGLTLQTWIRCFIICGDCPETRCLQNTIKELTHFKGIAIDWQGKDPLTDLICFYSDKYSSYQTLAEKSVLRENFTSYFNKFDKWLESVFKNINDCQEEEVVARIFYYSAFLIHKANHLIYTRSNPRSLLKGIVDVLLLPSNIYKPDFKLHQFVAKALNKQICLFLKGLILLDPKSDAFINRLVRDTIIHYVVRMDSGTIGNHPFLGLMEDQTCCEVVLDVFLQFKSKSMESQAFCALTMINHCCQEFVEERSLQIAIKSLEFIFELIMSSDDRRPIWTMSVQSLSMFLKWHQVREKIPQVLISLCKKNLAFNSTQWFGMITRISHLFVEEILQILPDIQEEITNVEKRRGVFEDPVLRQRFERLQSSIGAKP